MITTYHKYGAFLNGGDKRPVLVKLVSVILTIVLSILFAFTFTKYSGYDPEASMNASPASGAYGTDFGYQPTMRSYMFGVQFKF